jgi:hypothetical protein
LKTRTSILVVCATLFLGATSLVAHHGMAAIFNITDKITMKATLARLNWTNPHISVELEAIDDNGKKVAWTMESSPPGWYAKQGITKAEFDEAVGKPVTVIFLKALDGTKYGYFERITFPNGNVAYSMNGIKDKERDKESR